MAVRLIRHEVIPKCGSFEVRFSDGRESVYFYWEDIPGRRLRPDVMSSGEALEAARALARSERDRMTKREAHRLASISSPRFIEKGTTDEPDPP